MKALLPRGLAACFAWCACFCMMACRTRADVATNNVNVTVQVNSAATLTLSSASLTFPSANPALVTTIPANENGIVVTVKARTSATGTVLLTVVATGDLTNGQQTIPISNVSWAANGNGFQPGVLSKNTATTVGEWTGSGIHVGSLSYFLANSFAYATGTYTAQLSYTLTAF